MKKRNTLLVKIVICIVLLILIICGLIYVFDVSEKEKKEKGNSILNGSNVQSTESDDKKIAEDLYKQVYDLYILATKENGFAISVDQTDNPYIYPIKKKNYYKILDYNEHVDGLFTTEMEERFQTHNSIIKHENEYYQEPITGVYADNYRITVLKLENKDENKITYSADSYYCDFDKWNSATLSCSGEEVVIKSNTFAIVKESDVWLVDEFSRPT